MAKKNVTLLQYMVLAGILLFSEPQMARAASAPEPASAPEAGVGELPKPPAEPAESERPEREGPALREGPVPGSPFSPVTPLGDPFGLLPESGLAAGIPSGAAGIRLGPAYIYPAIGNSFLYDDNYFGSNTNRQSAFSTVFSPLIRAELRPRGGSIYALTYAADIGRNWDSSADNFVRQRLFFDSTVIITTRARLALQAQYAESFERRGSTDRPFGTEPDKRADANVAGLFSYGAVGARGRVDVEAGYQQSEYKNNRAVTAAFDHNTTFGGGAFYWRVMPKTSLLFRVRQSQIEYPGSAFADLSSTERQYGIGATWEATARTSGVFSFGQLKKEFDSPGREGYTGAYWEGNVTWAPRTYSNFNFSTAQHTSEATGIGDFAVSRVVFLTWNHAWTSRISSRVRGGYRTDDYRGAGVTRQDDNSNIGAGVSYQFRRWLGFGANYDHLRRSSNVPNADYDRNVFSITISATL